MPYTRISLFFIAVLAVFYTSTSPAWAVRVKNRDDIPHQLVVSTVPGDEKIVELAPGGIYLTRSPQVTLKLLTGEHPSTQTARYLDEFVIWPDGHLHIQKRRWPSHRAFGF